MSDWKRAAPAPRPYNLAAAQEGRQRRRNVVGALLIAGLVVGAAAVFFMDSLLSLLRREAILVAEFEAAPNIGVGAPVWIAGRPVGSVTRVEFLPVRGTGAAPRLALTLAVPASRLDQVRRDAAVQITSVRMISAPVVDILPGSPGEPPIAAGDTIRPRPTLTREEVTARAAALKTAADSLLAAVAPLRGRARERMAALAGVQAGFAGTQRELDALSAALAGSPALAFTEDPALARAIERMRAASANVSDITGNEDVARVRAALAPLTRHARELGVHLDSLSAAAGPNGTLARMQNDSALAVAMRGARAQLDSLIAEARSNPFRFVF